MKTTFYRNIQPHVEREYRAALEARNNGDAQLEFSHLERAHVLGQNATCLHTRTHCLMFLWALRQNDNRELLGQALRIVGAASKTVFGLVPVGNTGGANVSPFRVMDITPEDAKVIQEARGDV